MENIAGKVIGAGGFGCIFYPALKCKNKNKNFKGISKLSFKKEIEKEEKLNQEIKPIILKIKNHKNYFLINNIFTCHPDKLKVTDLENMDKCISLENLGINRNNINKNLDKLLILNEPYGGEDLYEYISKKEKNIITDWNFYNKKFLDLIKNAIIPMNKLGLIHNDMKSNNLLINANNLSEGIKIIDWGLCNIITNNRNIPDVIKNRGIQFNLPFSSILFNKSIQNIYNESLVRYKDIDNKIVIKNFIIYIFQNFYLKTGHTSYILSYIFPLIYKDDLYFSTMDIDEVLKNNGFKFIIKYLSKVLLNFTDFSKKKFDDKLYYHNVFSKNCDIWGFLTIYLDILLVVKLNKSNKKKLINIIKKYLYNEEFSIEVIDKENLLRDINLIKFSKNNTTRKVSKKNN